MTSQKTLSALQVADYILYKSKQEGKPITNKKLQKLLYYAQAWFFTLKNKPLFHEKIEAWVHGPVVKSVYFHFKEFGFEPISKRVSSKIVSDIGEDAAKFIDEVWNVYEKYDPSYLEYLTHSEKPWQLARHGIEPNVISENEITLESMRDFYSKKVKSS